MRRLPASLVIQVATLASAGVAVSIGMDWAVGGEGTLSPESEAAGRAARGVDASGAGASGVSVRGVSGAVAVVSWLLMVPPGSVAHARPSPAGDEGTGARRRGASSRPRPLGRADSSQDGIAASHRRRLRSVPEAAPRASPAISPRRFRSRHRAACMRAAVGRSSGSWARRLASPPCPPLPGAVVAPVLRGGVVPSYRCGAAPEWPILDGTASPASLFIRWVAPAGTDRHNISWKRILSTQNVVEHPQARVPRPFPRLRAGAGWPGTPRCASRSAARRCARTRRSGVPRRTAPPARPRRCTPG